MVDRNQNQIQNFRLLSQHLHSPSPTAKLCSQAMLDSENSVAIQHDSTDVQIETRGEPAVRCPVAEPNETFSEKRVLLIHKNTNMQLKSFRIYRMNSNQCSQDVCITCITSVARTKKQNETKRVFQKLVFFLEWNANFSLRYEIF